MGIYNWNMFLSKKSYPSGWHAARGVNTFVQHIGSKQWYLVHPKWTPYFRPTWFPHEDAMFTSFPKGSVKFQGKVPMYTVNLEPGDVLINPPFWWHQVNSGSDLTWGISWRVGTQAKVWPIMQYLAPHANCIWEHLFQSIPISMMWFGTTQSLKTGQASSQLDRFKWMWSGFRTTFMQDYSEYIQQTGHLR